MNFSFIDVNKLLANADLSLIKKTDMALKKFIEQKAQTKEGEEPFDEDVGRIVAKVCSESLVHGIAKCYDDFNTYDSYAKILTGSSAEPYNITKLMFTVLNGGKSVNSKVKFAKIYLIIGAEKGVNIVDAFLKIQKAISTLINSSKAGANGFKMGLDGSYFNACESIPESLKMLTDAINSSGINSDGHAIASIGINCESESFYNPDTNKYDMEGPKNLFEAEQMADWYIKLLKDYQLISYVEDPFWEIRGYQIFPTKLKDAGLDKTVKFGVSTFYKGNIETLKTYTQFIEKEEDEVNFANAEIDRLL